MDKMFFFSFKFLYVAISPQLPWLQSRFYQFLSGSQDSSSRAAGDKLILAINSSQANCFLLKPHSYNLTCTPALFSTRQHLISTGHWLCSRPHRLQTLALGAQRRGRRPIVAGYSSVSLLALAKPQTVVSYVFITGQGKKGLSGGQKIGVALNVV